jgi:hypothetical protein
MGAHRAFYALFKRTIPAGREIDHDCENNPCCNPAHLTCRTQRVNASLGGQKRHRPRDDGRDIPF